MRLAHGGSPCGSRVSVAWFTWTGCTGHRTAPPPPLFSFRGGRKAHRQRNCLQSASPMLLRLNQEREKHRTGLATPLVSSNGPRQGPDDLLVLAGGLAAAALGGGDKNGAVFFRNLLPTGRGCGSEGPVLIKLGAAAFGRLLHALSRLGHGGGCRRHPRGLPGVHLLGLGASGNRKGATECSAGAKVLLRSLRTSSSAQWSSGGIAWRGMA